MFVFLRVSHHVSQCVRYLVCVFVHLCVLCVWTFVSFCVCIVVLFDFVCVMCVVF